MLTGVVYCVKCSLDEWDDGKNINCPALTSYRTLWPHDPDNGMIWLHVSEWEVETRGCVGHHCFGALLMITDSHDISLICFPICSFSKIDVPFRSPRNPFTSVYCRPSAGPSPPLLLYTLRLCWQISFEFTFCCEFHIPLSSTHTLSHIAASFLLW